MSDASIKTILARLEGISTQVRKLDKHVATSDKANAERLDRAVLLLREAAELLTRKADAIDGIRERLDKLEGKGKA